MSHKRLGPILLAIAAVIVIIATFSHEFGLRPKAAGSTPGTPSRLEDVVSQFTATMPTSGSDGYDAPTADERVTFTQAVHAVTERRLGMAQHLLEPLDYGVRTLQDASTGRELVILTEVPTPDGEIKHGWGLYVINPAASTRVLVEVAHPLFDVNTPEIGTAFFEAVDAQALLIAGTHRYADTDGSADVAHAAGSVFDAVNGELLTGSTFVVQPHGFDESDHSEEGDVVLSGGVSPPPPAVSQVAAQLETSGISVCVYGVAAACRDLGGTENLQGRTAVKRGATFVQVEMSRAVRDYPNSWGAVVAALVAALT